MKAYRQVLGETRSEIVIEKSRFIGYLFPIKEEEDVKNILSKLKKEHYSASHHCYAYVLEAQPVPIERFSDDGEPGGTAGMPMLEVLRGDNIKNSLMVSVRYFGGTKLGTGGLVRAYTQSIKETIASGDMGVFSTYVRMLVEVDYSLSGSLEHFLMSSDCIKGDTIYTDQVTYDIYVLKDYADEFYDILVDRTNNSAKIQREKPFVGYEINGRVFRS